MLDNLSPEHTRYIAAAIASGRYENEAEALNQAVRLLQRRDQMEQSLQAASAEFASGGGIPEEDLFDFLEETIAKAEGSAQVEAR